MTGVSPTLVALTRFALVPPSCATQVSVTRLLELVLAVMDLTPTLIVEPLCAAMESLSMVNLATVTAHAV